VRDAVARLARRGVAYIILAHLVWRHIATDAPAIPFLPDWLYKWLFPQPDEGLSNLGRAALEAMVSERVLIDLSHMSERSVSDVLDRLDELAGPTEPPVIATHSGFRFGSQEYMLSENTIRRIAERDGVVGLIMAQHQLCDGITRLPVRSLDRSMEIIDKHIKRIAAITNGYDHLAIGSDLDGFIKPTMGGVESSADMARLSRELRLRYDEQIAHKICFDNAMRVLRAGWGGGAVGGGAAGDGVGAGEPRAGAPPQRI
jgi:microsomal dipeptidase-like Zn-dependent dipeptidase